MCATLPTYLKEFFKVYGVVVVRVNLQENMRSGGWGVDTLSGCGRAPKGGR